MRVVESLPATACGALVVGTDGSPLGTILIEANRVCWGAAEGMSGRLKDILRSHCDNANGAELSATYELCRREHLQLSDVLMDCGLFTSERLRAALKQHTIESLLAVDAAVDSLWGKQALEWPMQWVDHGGGYSPRHTFAAVELLAAAGRQRWDEHDAALVTAHFARLADASSALVAFSQQLDGTPIYVGCETALPLEVQDLLDLTSWAEAALGASLGFSAAVAQACTRAADGGTVAWRYDGQRCVALCVDGASLRRLTATLGDQSIAMVLATRTAVLDRVRDRIPSFR